ncbi:NRDE family protein [Aliiglaciecola lipolytica]|uniref:Ser/Thr-rich protein T10 in DGCR region n=1 Tax=Aliiglaciecola lipolytica E3 TaxID=1127673 RepID=K6Y9M7_9ALTE|nr:NRDE family protein [Aliiglaciecola lipolytica]GAC14882.1 Ser/Thr-rich protein T10 in DGCR region [Aliiglaciecola lipolytica E3]
MCILFIAVEQHPDYPLIIAANRDEFYQRETAQSKFWDDNEQVLAGRDLEAGGTWMGMNKNGRLCALTNVRDPQKILTNATSRGYLVSEFLTNQDSQLSYLAKLQESKHQYNGYNLMFGQWNNLWVYNNHTDKLAKLTAGVYGLSNADLDSPWPKINQGVNKLKEHCQQAQALNTDKLFAILLDQTQARDELLPKTGVPIDWERKLSSIFIQSPDYGTRSSTLLLVNKNKHVTWLEHTFDNQGINRQQRSFNFYL